MWRGTTPIHTFTLPDEFNGVEYECLYITYDQRGENVLEKSLYNGKIENGTIVLQLSQSETLEFKCNRPVDIQMRIKTKTGDALASNIVTIPIEEILKDGEI